MTTRKQAKFLYLFFILPLASDIVAYPSERRIRIRDVERQEETENKPKVFLTVSSLASYSDNEIDRMLEMNWYNIPSDALEKDAWVRLYSNDPLRNSSNPLSSVRPTADGYYRTSVRFPEQTFTRNNLTDTCLGFWIAYTEESQILSSNCIRARPSWMHQAQSVIGNFSLIELMIPGTHNTGCYAAYDASDDNLFNRYLLTQEENVWNQLVYGIRYLDLRVAYKSTTKSPERLWITHGNFVRDVTVRDIIQQVKRFLDSTEEIVIMDFHRFVNGFKGRRAARRHRELITMLEQELGEYMIPVRFTSWASLNVLWNAEKRLYVGYADENARRQSLYLFPAIRHLWGDVDTREALRDYLNQTVCDQSRARRLTSAMAELTPTAAGSIFDIYRGLRNMAHEVNRYVTKWFREDWNNCANIVATDFFMGNNLIEVAIEINMKRQADVNSLMF